MRKKILSVCFLIAVLGASLSWAQPVEVKDLEAYRAEENQVQRTVAVDPRIPDSANVGAVEDFIRDRFENYNLIIDKMPDDDSVGAVDIQHSEDYIAEANKDKKSTFDEIYEQALNRVSTQEAQENQEVLQNRNQMALENQKQQRQWQENAPNFPVVNVFLPPKGEQVLVPAQEHIPFFFSEVEILPTSQVKIDETVVVVANGQKLKHGLTRALPRYATSRDGRGREIDVNLSEVMVDDVVLPYKIKASGNYLLLVPEKEYTLAPGVYTYKFSYVVNRDVWDYDKFNEFYWDATASSWNLVIARAGVLVTLPANSKPWGQSAFSGLVHNLQTDVVAYQPSQNTMAYVASRPLFAGEGLHFILSMQKADFVAPDTYQIFTDFLNDYGDIVIAALVLLVVLSAYYLSWRGMKKRYDDKLRLPKFGPLLRLLAFNKIDKVSFSSYLLHLFYKGVVDLKENEQGVVMLSFLKTKAKGLKFWEKKFLKKLFKSEQVCVMDKSHAPHIKAAYACLEKGLKHSFNRLLWRLNLSYLFFSFAMLVLAEAAIAHLGYNFMFDFGTMLSCTVTFAFGFWLFNKAFKRKWLKWCMRVLAVLSIVLDWFVLSFFIHMIAAVLIVAVVFVIYAYSNVFARRNGLIKNNVKEALAYKDFLVKHADTIALGKSFGAEQENIHALDADAAFSPNAQNKAIYRLDVAQKIDSLL